MARPWKDSAVWTSPKVVPGEMIPMKSPIRALALASVATLALAFSNVASAQFDTGGGGVEFKINGQIPGNVNATTHEVGVYESSTMTFSVTGGTVGVPFILAGGLSLSPAALSIPTVGTVDLAGAYVILDGISGGTPFDLMARTNFSVTLPTTPGTGLLVGAAAPALQAIYVEPLNPPFNFEITQAGQAMYQGLRRTVYNTLGDDVTQAHVLTNVPTVTFGGVAYTTVLIGSNGMITFGVGSTDWTPSTAEFFAGFRAAGTLGANPGVAPLWADWASPSAANDNVTVIESLAAGTVKVEYNNQLWYSSLLSAGSWSCEFGTFGPNSFMLDLSGALPGSATDSTPMTGVTDGDDLNGPNTTLANFSAALPYSSTSAPDSVCQIYTAGGIGASPYNLGVVNFLDPSGTFNWTIF